MVIGDHFGGGDRFDGGDHFGGGTIPSTCACGEAFMIGGGFINQRHKELRDLEAEFLNKVCSDVEIEPVLQDIFGEQLKRGSNKAQDARLDIQARRFWERH